MPDASETLKNLEAICMGCEIGSVVPNCKECDIPALKRLLNLGFTFSIQCMTNYCDEWEDGESNG